MSDVLLERRDAVALVTLNRPETLNAMGGELVPRLAEALAEAEADPAVRCVAITGAGRAFCAGGDIRGMQERNERMAAAAAAEGPGAVVAELDRSAAELRDRHRAITLRIHTMPKPVVALVNGPAVGAGFSIALACDIRLASDRARFGAAFRNVGLPGDFGGTYFLSRLCGPGIARELYFTAEIIDAARALELRIVNRVIPHDELFAHGLEFCQRLAAGPTAAYARMKENFALAETAPLDRVLDQEALSQRLAGFSFDSREAVAAFLEKREPRFTGR
ncbi:MAG: CoA isomerase [Tepidiforma sp.]|nr:enoyl-CoA hydratase-related protein [Tepidiforma sp.]GIW13751.1 MAG: CoA isomerase [Tepidiforma sp.]GIW19696.1 MAG: CoA isomerase [Tepidiforma sp.]